VSSLASAGPARGFLGLFAQDALDLGVRRRVLDRLGELLLPEPRVAGIIGQITRDLMGARGQ
jgi:hypothetical protein